MPGPAPKPAGTRARRNKATTAAKLRPDPELTAPDLPSARAWHPQTAAWWADVWASPMAPEFDASDSHGLVMLAGVVDDFWTAESPSARLAAAAEIRQQSQRFGLSPLDRRRLQWEIERSEEAQDRGEKRRAAAGTGRAAPDPRSSLHVV